MKIRDKAFADYQAGMKYKEIAEKYGVSVSAVKSWATRYWKVATKGKKLQPKRKKVATKKAEDEVQKVLLEAADENGGLNEQQRLFCLYYATSHNALQSYLKAYQCSKNTASVNSCRLLVNASIQTEVKKLRNVMRQHLDIGRDDLIQYCLKVVGADIGDYVSFKGSKVTLTDSTMVDTSIISEVKRGKDGIAIKLEEKQWAWSMLVKLLGLDEHEELKKEKLKAEVSTMQESDTEKVVIIDDIPDEEYSDNNIEK